MRKFYFKDVLFMNKEKVLSVENDMKEHVGYIKKADMDKCEKGIRFLIRQMMIRPFEWEFKNVE